MCNGSNSNKYPKCIILRRNRENSKLNDYSISANKMKLKLHVRVKCQCEWQWNVDNYKCVNENDYKGKQQR